jgi:hypothetical protein
LRDSQERPLASIKVTQILKRRGHPEGSPPTISDGWGGIAEAILAVYSNVPEFTGWGRPPPRKKGGSKWRYLQMVKQREEHRRIQGIKLKVVFGKKSEVLTLLGVCTGYIERCNLTNRHFKERQVRNTLTFSKGL